jgi:hypothetical protein
MKNIKNQNSLRSFLLAICLVVFVVTLTGCIGTQSETATEQSRRWGHIFRSNVSQIPDDIEAILMMDKRSKLTDNLIRDL